MLSDLTEVKHGITDVEGLRRGHVAIGATPSLSATLLPTVLARFHRRHPGVSLAVTERASEHLVEGLESGILDLALAVMSSRLAMLEQVVLAVEELVVVTAADHVLAGRRRITIADLRDVPMIMFTEGYDVRSTTLAAFDRAGIAPSVALEGVEMSSVLSMVAAGLGAAIVPSIVATADVGLNVLRLESPRLETRDRVAETPGSRAVACGGGALGRDHRLLGQERLAREGAIQPEARPELTGLDSEPPGPTIASVSTTVSWPGRRRLEGR